MTDIEFITETLQRAGEFARERYKQRAHLAVETKRDANDFVTEADIAVQRDIVEHIARQFPGDFVLAEESGLDTRPEAVGGRCWILDPIDGTSNFVRGLFAMWGISLGLAVRGEIVAGGVLFPMADDLFLAERGAGARRNGTPCTASIVDVLDHARLDLDISAATYRYETIERAPEIYRRAGQLRVHGCAVAALCAVAAGEMEAYLHVALNPWDFAAGQILVEEAGGVVSTWDGGRPKFFEGRASIAATNAPLHAETLSLLRGK